MEFSKDNYIVIQGTSIVNLHLSGNELICYSLIQGFCQDGESTFKGSLNYIASALNITKQNAKAVIDRLCKKGLVNKVDKYINGVKFCEYSVNNNPVAETITPYCRNNNGGVAETATGGVAETATNNTIINNIFDNNKDNNKQEKIKNKKETTFRDSEVFQMVNGDDYSKLIEHFAKNKAYQGIDIVYYFHCILDWSDQHEKEKRTARGWLATFNTFIRRDKENNKIHTIQQQQPNEFAEGALFFLNM